MDLSTKLTKTTNETAAFDGTDGAADGLCAVDFSYDSQVNSCCLAKNCSHQFGHGGVKCDRKTRNRKIQNSSLFWLRRQGISRKAAKSPGTQAAENRCCRVMHFSVIHFSVACDSEFWLSYWVAGESRAKDFASFVARTQFVDRTLIDHIGKRSRHLGGRRKTLFCAAQCGPVRSPVWTGSQPRVDRRAAQSGPARLSSRWSHPATLNASKSRRKILNGVASAL